MVIAGGTGLIGRELVHDIAEEGHQITVLSRSPKDYRHMFSEEVDLVYWDDRSAGEWVSHIEGVDAVVNLAGESISGAGFLPDRWSADKKKRIRESRIAAGKALVMAIEAAENKPRVLVQASAVGYYGSTGDTLVTESSPSGGDFLASVAQDWEASTELVEGMGVRRVVARIGLVLSTEDGALPRLLLPSRLFAGGWFGSGDQWWSWVHIADVVSALRFLVEDDVAQGPVNVTAPNPLTNREFGKALGRALNRPSVMPVPAFALRAALGEVASTVLEGQRAIPKRLLEMDFAFRFPDIDSALNNLVSG
jgi:hypothetical protein